MCLQCALHQRVNIPLRIAGGFGKHRGCTTSRNDCADFSSTVLLKRFRSVLGSKEAARFFNFYAFVANVSCINVIENILFLCVKGVSVQAGEFRSQRMESIVGADFQRLVFGDKRFKAGFIQRGKLFFDMSQSKLRIENIGVAVGKIVQRHGIVG